MKKKILMIMVLCLAVFLAGCMSKASKPIAEVNGDKITQADYDALYAVIKADYESTQNVKVDEQKDKEIVKNIQDKTFDNLILQKLIRQDAARQGIKIDQKEVDETIAYIKSTKDKESQDGFKKFLKETNFTETGLNEYLQTQQLNTKIKDKITAGIKVDDAQVRQYYDDNQNQFEDQGGIHIYHILTSDKQKALEVINKLDSGADFAVLAKEYSLDESNKNLGGDLQYVNENTNFVPEFKKAALALKPGQYTQEPVKSQFGYHVIKAGERKAAGIMPFDQVQEQLKAQLEAEQKDSAFNEYLEKLKKEADIKDLRKK
ncbi:Peptidyl-prolyl cis-trans isomerase, PpiC-type [Syntrophomonas zehnderi OL-4]|uniref:peptidylprolyl isomerase n=1 Tax=Syntrophomonas zehnderi OL-4 TaxID=690567 RepID=A0A0E4C837_9FIRM|nr:peptidyl-prolyl cis-trans isomerase [Syntrophomonas zehnderi]CFX22399.1 Peptidyl-prolyl cis-trans isomerase, PpiC-type [Syntrophomonas zehnderi OL-4]